MNPLVSILIPVYKRKELCVETIECALKQDYENIEIVVVDNDSQDGTFEFLKKTFASETKIHFYENDVNLGATGNWNRCFQESHGKYIKFLWSDDLITSDHIGIMARFLENHPDSAFVYSTIKPFVTSDEEEITVCGCNTCVKFGKIEFHKKRNRYFMNKSGEYDGSVFIDGIYTSKYDFPVSPACALFRRSKVIIENDIENNIGFEHHFTGAGPDLLIFLHAIQNGEKFGHINKPISYFRVHENSFSGSDPSIGDGYLTAKVFFLKNKVYEQLFCLWLAAEILIVKNIQSNDFNIIGKTLEPYFGDRIVITLDSVKRINKYIKKIKQRKKYRVLNKFYGRLFFDRK